MKKIRFADTIKLDNHEFIHGGKLGQDVSRRNLHALVYRDIGNDKHSITLLCNSSKAPSVVEDQNSELGDIDCPSCVFEIKNRSSKFEIIEG